MSNENPYDRFDGKDLILRDELAIDRTILANERTLLAYLRGSIALVLVGITFIQFGSHPALLYIGLVCVPIGVAVGVFGYVRYRRMNRAIRRVRHSLTRNAAESEAGPRRE